MVGGGGAAGGRVGVGGGGGDEGPGPRLCGSPPAVFVSASVAIPPRGVRFSVTCSVLVQSGSLSALLSGRVRVFSILFKHPPSVNKAAGYHTLPAPLSDTFLQRRKDVVNQYLQFAVTIVTCEPVWPSGGRALGW